MYYKIMINKNDGDIFIRYLTVEKLKYNYDISLLSSYRKAIILKPTSL